MRPPPGRSCCAWRSAGLGPGLVAVMLFSGLLALAVFGLGILQGIMVAALRRNRR